MVVISFICLGAKLFHWTLNQAMHIYTQENTSEDVILKTAIM